MVRYVCCPRGPSCYRRRLDVQGDVYTGFTSRWGPLFGNFRAIGACGSAPAGIVFILLHRLLVGVSLGAFAGIDAKITQVACLLSLCSGLLLVAGS